MRYSAPGNSEIVDQICGLLAPHQVEHDQNWGFDHGTWSVLCHVFPDASVPVVQLSVARTLTPQAHYELGRMLAPLRDQGVLVAGSGNIVHNLREYAWGQEDAAPFPWAVSFEHKIRDALLRGDVSTLTGYASLGDDARRSVPTPEHYLPLLHVAGTRDPSDAVTFPVEGIDGGSISMLSVRIG